MFYNGNVIEYIYAADGTRLRTIHRTAVSGIRVSTSGSHTLTAAETLALDSTDYVGAFLFHGNSFSKYLFDDGYVTYTGSTPSLHFYLHDHQGNNRAVAEFATLSHVNASLSQTTYYYPYGGVFGDLGSYPESQPYKYNGKEFDRMHGLDWYDYGARQYDPAIARFTSMDPLTEKYYHISPYAYCAGNPVNYVDPDGRDWRDTGNGIEWTEYKSQEEMVQNNIDGRYLGPAVVVFNGSREEMLGDGGNLYGEGAVLADVTVYGPKSLEDVGHYKGFTMSSDRQKFGVIEDGEYSVKKVKMHSTLDLTFAIENGGKVPALDDYNPAFPKRNPAYLEGTYIHRSNWNGFAGSYNKKSKDGYWTTHGVSEGCLLVEPKKWNEFYSQLKEMSEFKLILRR